jgi:hypothetical protein
LEKAVWGLALMTGATFAGLNGASVIERRGMAVLVMDWLAPVVDEMPAGFSAPTPWVWDHGLQLAKASLRGELQDSDVV